MIEKLILGLVISCTLIMCSEKTKTTEQTENWGTEVKPFKSVYDTLDQMEIPVTFRSDEWSDLSMRHLEKYGVKERWELMHHPYAKLVDSLNYKAIIFVSTDQAGSPTLITIDRIGNPIDTLFLLDDWASNDPSNGTLELATINEDLTIHLSDSVSTYDLGPDGDRRESTRKVTVTDKLYRIRNSGVIEMIR
jgi:hypothetical protein